MTLGEAKCVLTEMAWPPLPSSFVVITTDHNGTRVKSLEAHPS